MPDVTPTPSPSEIIFQVAAEGDPEASVSATPSISVSPDVDLSPTPTPTISDTPSVTPSVTPTISPTDYLPSPTPTPTISVTPSGQATTFLIDTLPVTFPNTESSSSFDLTVAPETVTWSSSVSDSWITLTPGPAYGTGSQAGIEFRVSGQAGGAAARTGSITLTSQYGDTATYTFYQAVGPSPTPTPTISLTPTPSQDFDYLLSATVNGGVTGSIAFATTSASLNINTTTDSAPLWEATSSNDWVTFSNGTRFLTGNGDTTVELTVAANTGDQRSNTITFKGRGVYDVAGMQDDVLIVQAAAAADTFLIDTLPVTFPNTESSSSFDLTVSPEIITWSSSVSDSWITLTPGPAYGTGSQAGIEFRVSGQAGGAAARTGSITITSQYGDTATYTFYQAVGPSPTPTPSISVTPSTPDLPPSATPSISVSPGPTPTPSPGVFSTFGEYDGANPDPQDLNYDGTQQTTSLEVQCTTEAVTWEITSGVNWADFSLGGEDSTYTGTGDETGITLYIDKNITGASRSGTIQVAGTGEFSGLTPISINIAQTSLGLVASFSGSSIGITQTATIDYNDSDVHIYADTFPNSGFTWNGSVTSSGNWIKFTDLGVTISGTGDFEEELLVSNNTGTTSRTGTLNIVGTGDYSGISSSATLIQQPEATLSLLFSGSNIGEASSVTASYNDSDINFTINTISTLGWVGSVTSSGNWLKFTSLGYTESGTGPVSGDEIIALNNNTGSPRTGTFNIRGTGEYSYLSSSATILQEAAPTLTVQLSGSSVGVSSSVTESYDNTAAVFLNVNVYPENATWSAAITESGNWFLFSGGGKTASGTGDDYDGEFFLITDNPTTGSRTATVTVATTGDDAGVTGSATFLQHGIPYVSSFSGSYSSVNYAAQTIKLSVDVTKQPAETLNWRVSSSEDWVTFTSGSTDTDYTGSNAEANFNLYVLENSTGGSRQTTLTIESTNHATSPTKTFTVYQAPAGSPSPTPSPGPASPTPSISITPSVTPTISVTPSVTPTISITPTISVTPSISITPSLTPTPSPTPGLICDRDALTRTALSSSILTNFADNSTGAITPAVLRNELTNLICSTVFLTGSNTITGGFNLSGSLLITGSVTFTGNDIRLTGLPSSDPGTTGALWNDNGTLKISTISV